MTSTLVVFIDFTLFTHTPILSLSSFPNILTWDQFTLISSLNNLSMQAPGSCKWYMDSEAKAHMSSEASILSSLSPVSSPFPYILVGNGATIPIIHIGHTSICSLHCPLLLNNVLVTPIIIKNLVSIRKFTTNNLCSVEFDLFVLFVKDLQTKKEILHCNSSSGLYPLCFNASTLRPHTFASLDASTDSWHHHLRHLGCHIFQSFLKQSAFRCTKACSSLCHSCHLRHHSLLQILLLLLHLN